MMASCQRPAGANSLCKGCIACGGVSAEESISGLAQVTTEKQREAFQKELAQAEDWLYEDGEAQPAAVFK